MTDTTPELVTVEANPSPGPGGRVQRMTAQIGGTGIILELVIAFGWLGSSHWTVRQGLAVSAAAYWAVGAAHNGVNWWTNRGHARTAESVTVTGTPAARSEPARRRKAIDS